MLPGTPKLLADQYDQGLTIINIGNDQPGTNGHQHDMSSFQEAGPVFARLLICICCVSIGAQRYERRTNARIVKILSNVSPIYNRLSLNSGSKKSPYAALQENCRCFDPYCLYGHRHGRHPSPGRQTRKRNLKVLPKDISHDDLEKVMDNWKAALGVKCEFLPCAFRRQHLPPPGFRQRCQAGKEHRPPYVPHDGKINKKYFSFNKDDKGAMPVPAITCMTCHRGSPHPDEVTK